MISSEVIDLTGTVLDEFSQIESQYTCPEAFEFVLVIDEADTFLWNPEEDLKRADGDDAVVITLNYVNKHR